MVDSAAMIEKAILKVDCNDGSRQVGVKRLLVSSQSNKLFIYITYAHGKIMLKLKIIAAVVGTLVISKAYAQETYNIQAGLQNRTMVNDSNFEETSTIFSGTYYLKNIVINNTQPFMELAFLQKASNVTVNYGNVSVETTVLYRSTYSPLHLGGTFYHDNFIFGFNNQTWDKAFSLKSNTDLNLGIKTSSTGFNVGYFVTPTTAISFVNSKSNANYTRSSDSMTALNDYDMTTNGVTSHTVMSLGDTQSLVVDLDYRKIKKEQTNSETNTEYSAKFRYYPEAKSFFEGGYKSNSGDNDGDKGKTMLFGAGYSFTPRFAVMLLIEQFSGDVSTEKSSSSSTMLTAGYRF